MITGMRIVDGILDLRHHFLRNHTQESGGGGRNRCGVTETVHLTGIMLRSRV